MTHHGSIAPIAFRQCSTGSLSRTSPGYFVNPSIFYYYYYYFWKVLQNIRHGQSKGISCLVIQPNFFCGKDYDVGTINSHLKRSKLGYSQARKCYRDGNSRSVRVIILHTTAFTEDELHSILRGQCVFFCKRYIVTQPTVTPFPPPKTSHLPNTHRSLFFKAVSD